MNALLNNILWAATALGSLAFGLQSLGYGTLFTALPLVVQQVLGALMLVGGLLSLVNYVYHILGSDQNHYNKQ